MDIFVGFFNTITSSVLSFLVILTIVVFFHELGHFLVARWNGVGVAKFAVGMGPDICSFVDKHGTKWALSAIPIGGYVKFIDDANASSVKAETEDLIKQGANPDHFFSRKKLWQRAAIVAAGPIANFILAIVIFTGLFWASGRQIVTPRIESVLEDSVAQKSGFQVGDLITAVGATPIESFSELQRIVTVNPDVDLTFSVLRDGSTLKIKARPELVEVDDGFGGKMRIGRIGISRTNDPDSIIVKEFNLVTAFGEGVHETFFVAKRTVHFFVGLIAGRESIDQLGGPLRIAEVSGQVASVSLLALVSLTAILSVSIGIMNLLPIPVLDGGHLVFYAIEGLRGRPLSERTQQVSFNIGFACLLTMMFLVTTLDINRWIERFL